MSSPYSPTTSPTAGPHEDLPLDSEAQAEQARETQRRRKELEDLRWMMGHPQGRRVIGRLLEFAGVFRSSFNSGAAVMAFNEGRRDTGLFLTAELMEANPEGYFKILRERADG